MAQGPDAPYRDHAFAGLRLRSGIALPELPDLTLSPESEEAEPDCVIVAGPVPARLPDLLVDRPLLQIGADGACRFTLPGVAAWWIAPDGRRVVVEQHGPDAAEMRSFLFGTVIAIVLIRHGLLPLHACCLERDGRAIALCGNGGAGKSTLAARLLRRGYRLLADDMAVVDLSRPGRALALPTLPHIGLWRKSLELLGIEATSLDRVRPSIEKYSLSETARFCAEPLPLTGLFLISEPLVPHDATHQILPPMEALKQASSMLYRQQMMLRMGLGAWQMRQHLALLAGVGGCVAIRRPDDDAAIDALSAIGI